MDVFDDFTNFNLFPKDVDNVNSMIRVLGIKLLPRMILFICFLTVLYIVILTHCGLNMKDENMATPSEVEDGHKFRGLKFNSAEKLMRQREDENAHEVARLTAEIKKLRLQLLHYKDTFSLFADEYKSAGTSIPAPAAISISVPLHVKSAIQSAEILHGTPFNNEYEIISFSHFSSKRIYPVDLGLGKRVVEKPMGAKRKDLSEILLKSLDYLNAKNVFQFNKSTSVDKKYTSEDFVEGIYRTDPLTGTEYALIFRNKHAVGNYTKLTLVRPFVPAVTVNEQLLYGRGKEIVHVIVPLSGRIDSFQRFIDKFCKIGFRHDRRVHLTVVYFGNNGLGDIRSIFSRISQTKGNNHYLRLLELNETFSRSKGLEVATKALSLQKKDALLFMCDVDVVFSARFLERCRWNAVPGKQVYYPIMFSLYNPQIVYTLQGKNIPSEADQLVISRDTGFWKDFGYGMTCQYLSDFNRLQVFDENAGDVGGEDVVLYRKYVRSSIKVIRATDPGIFHTWHPKVCSRNTSGYPQTFDQYRACIRLRALNEASHAQLGFLAFP